MGRKKKGKKVLEGGGNCWPQCLYFNRAPNREKRVKKKETHTKKGKNGDPGDDGLAEETLVLLFFSG